MKNKITTIVILAILLFSVAACKKNATTPTSSLDCSNIPASFANDVVPIINNACVSCHNSGYAYGDFTSYLGIKAKIDNGSFKLRTIDQKSMPPSNLSGPTSLTSTELNILSCWIEAGAPEN